MNSINEFHDEKVFNALDQHQIKREDSIQAIGFTVCHKNKILVLGENFICSFG